MCEELLLPCLLALPIHNVMLLHVATWKCLEELCLQKHPFMVCRVDDSVMQLCSSHDAKYVCVLLMHL